MQLKNHVALLLVVIFLGKLVTVDSKGFGALLDSSGMTLVNKMCSKKLPNNKTSEDLSTDTVIQGLEMDFLCHTAFDHNITEWGVTMTEDNFREYNYQTPGVFSSLQKKFYPPPKV
ncbi:hypothetical protein [Salinimicrobium gaetbulicola]|uniref:Uncharacterized protein n=1 Tax=Salinimicrobium gaetbulicola TaxID=999702 RepID=A0ABW3IDV6_9FLAO